MESEVPDAVVLDIASSSHAGDIFTYVMAAVYIATAAIYTIINISANTSKVPRSKIQDVLQDNAIVLGLTSILYVLLAAGLPPWIRWPFYAVCSTLLFDGLHLVTTRRSYTPDGINSLFYDSSAYRLGLILTPFIMLTGLIGHFVTLAVAIVVFVFGTLALAALFYTTYRSIAMAPQQRVSDALIAGYVVLALPWLVYPIIYALSPVIGNVIDFSMAQIGYLSLDIISKFLFGILLLVGATQAEPQLAYRFGLRQSIPQKRYMRV